MNIIQRFNLTGSVAVITAAWLAVTWRSASPKNSG